ncbi:hypothetical protein BH11PLA2_BH11PLA2_19170 [soil metagenome]
MPDAITLIVPVRTLSAQPVRVVQDWSNWLKSTKREHTILVVDDGIGITDEFKNPFVKLLRHETPQGFGACLRTALPEATHPLVSYVTSDYPYSPASMAKMLERFEKPVDVYGTMKPVDAVSGCRGGSPVPPVWKAIGRVYRIGVRVALGYKPEPLPGWLGFRNHFRSWWLWLLMGVPLVDVTSGLKVFRRELFDRFPIQSDGDFAHAEIIAKLTFMNGLIAEEPLPASTAAIPVTEFSDFGTVFRNAIFAKPKVAPVADVVDVSEWIDSSQKCEL